MSTKLSDKIEALHDNIVKRVDIHQPDWQAALRDILADARELEDQLSRVAPLYYDGVAAAWERGRVLGKQEADMAILGHEEQAIRAAKREAYEHARQLNYAGGSCVAVDDALVAAIDALDKEGES